jgi:D-alanyl-D-alanine carboxypeptidase (penicillin-binding protein 5/6)
VSRSPFIASRSSRRPHQARRRWRGRALAGATALVAVAVLAALAAGLDVPGNHAHAAARQSASLPGSSTDAVSPAALSPLGLPLGRPPLTLRSTPDGEPVRVRFQVPPRSGILFNLDSGRILWERDPRRRLPIASLTKMMTALIVAERSPPSARVLITPQALAFQGSGVGLLPRGRRVPLEALLNGLLLPSGNDAAIALAQHEAGSVAAFVRMMNVRAAQLGLSCTRYSSPHGFSDHDNYSCAADLAVLARADLARPRLARITRRRSVVEPFPIKDGKLYLYNNNPLVARGYPGITGLKTGFTVAAGPCLVATAKRHGVRLGVVLLHSPDPASQAQRLLDAAFQRVYGQAPVAAPVSPPGGRPRGVPSRLTSTGQSAKG